MSLPSREWVDRDLPLSNAKVSRAISNPAGIVGELPLGTLSTSKIREWGSLLISEQEGHEPVAAIVDRLTINGDMLQVEAGGWSMYPMGTPWLGKDWSGVQQDPLAILRMIWAHVQSYPDSDLGVVVDSLVSPVRVGTKEEQVSFKTDTGEEVSFTAGPFTLNWWSTDDLARVINDLAADTPFQYMERNSWLNDGEEIRHRLQLGYPAIGVRRPNLRFEIGVNVTLPPPLDEGDYASEILMLGAGEGRKKVRAPRMTRKTDRLRRVKVVTDSTLDSSADAARAARPILDRMTAAYSVDQLSIIDHEAAPLGSFNPGDEIRLIGDAGWEDLNMWVRVSETEVDCETGDVTLRVEAV
jgi:hypothetical protein